MKREWKGKGKREYTIYYLYDPKSWNFRRRKWTYFGGGMENGEGKKRALGTKVLYLVAFVACDRVLSFEAPIFAIVALWKMMAIVGGLKD